MEHDAGSVITYIHSARRSFLSSFLRIVIACVLLSVGGRTRRFTGLE